MPAVSPKFYDDDLLPILIFAVLGALACITPAQNDTFWHLRSGQLMWQTGSWLMTEPFSHTAGGAPLDNHWWLSQLLFYGAYGLGGPFLLTVLAGACAAASVAGSWRLMRGPWELRILLLAFLVVATAPEWSVRPQVFSLLLLVLMAHLVVHDRIVWLPVVCVVWANAHAMVVFGVVLAIAVLLDAFLWSRQVLKRAAAVAIGCVLAPMISPLGWNYWPRVLTTVSMSRDLEIQEYQMPIGIDHLPFWAASLTLLGLLALQRHRLRECERADRILLLAALVLAVAAGTASRNIAFFSVIAGPVLSRLWPVSPRAETRRRPPRPLGAPAAAICLVAVAVGTAAVIGRWQDGGARLGWRPVSTAAIEAVRHCPDPIFNQMEDGGFLMWTLPARRVFVDSRMEAYPLETLRASRQADLHGEYQSLFGSYRINCALVTTGSQLSANLANDPLMAMTFQDKGRTVFVRKTASEGRYSQRKLRDAADTQP